MLLFIAESVVLASVHNGFNQLPKTTGKNTTGGFLLSSKSPNPIKQWVLVIRVISCTLLSAGVPWLDGSRGAIKQSVKGFNITPWKVLDVGLHFQVVLFALQKVGILLGPPYPLQAHLSGKIFTVLAHVRDLETTANKRHNEVGKHIRQGNIYTPEN